MDPYELIGKNFIYEKDGIKIKATITKAKGEDLEVKFLSGNK